MNGSVHAVLAPAKINLFLSVGRPDERGYHPLRTVFQAVSLWDELTVSLGAGSGVTFDREDIPEQNTVSKAIDLFSKQTDTPAVSVSVRKRIPLESGLGGGSSDAAAVLRSLQSLLGNPLSEETLHRIALQVGADVPFFLIGGRARAEGYGEKLTPLPDPPGQWLVLARPDERCSTAAMFGKLDDLRYPRREFPKDDAETYNDFERVAPCACLDLIERLRTLGAEKAGLSGSGSGVFGFVQSESMAQTIATRLRAESIPWAVPARTLGRAESL